MMRRSVHEGDGAGVGWLSGLYEGLCQDLRGMSVKAEHALTILWVL